MSHDTKPPREITLGDILDAVGSLAVRLESLEGRVNDLANATRDLARAAGLPLPDEIARHDNGQA